MKHSKPLIALIIILILNLSPLHAFSIQGTRIDLNGGNINPSEFIYIDTSQLNSSLTYTIKCELYSDIGSKADNPVVAKIDSNPNTCLIFNDMSNISRQVSVNLGKNTFSVWPLQGGKGNSHLIIWNYDDAASFLIKNCYAIPVTF